MPPHNSPTRPSAISNQATDGLPPELTSSTRLPIVRRSGTNTPHVPRWRLLLDRAMDQVSDTTQDWTDYNPPEVQHARAEYNSAQRLAYERQRLQGMSTYRGWAPGTTESDRSPGSQPVRQVSRNDLSPRSNATRRFRRELEMHGLARMENPNRIVEEERARLRADASDITSLPQSTRQPRPHATASLLESLRRRTRVEMLRERINNFTGTRNIDSQGQMRDQRDITSQPANSWNSANQANDDGQTNSARPKALVNEQHLTRIFEEAISILDTLRFCSSQDDRLAVLENAESGCFTQVEMFANDKTLDPKDVSKPHFSSLLRAGARFTGQQTASILSGMPELLRMTRRARRRAEESWDDQNNASAEITRPWAHGVVSAASAASGESPKDCWPVTVTITSVDYKSMTLTGTMEAFNVPSTKGTNLIPRDPNISSITTYLEGEIIDFDKHTLRTTNFKADSADDANYWRKLEPFKSLNIEQIVDGLTDMAWLSETIAQNWIIMRWKEKCFVSPTDANSGLTISGFYYVTLRRCDGKIEGLYHDPHSCPYQRLNLMPGISTFPVYAIR